MISKILLLFDDAQTQLGYQEEIKDYFKKATLIATLIITLLSISIHALSRICAH